jgi:DNA ligase-1
MLGDLAEGATLAREGRLHEATLTPLRPIAVMLASPEPDATSVLERASAWTAPHGPRDVWIEDKYDGIRCQLHKQGDRVALFTRDLKEITATFPELTAAARTLPGSVILDGEVLGMEGDQVIPFTVFQRRLGRSEGDLFLQTEVPVRFLVFDLLHHDGVDWIHRPLRERRAALESLGLPERFTLARITRVSTADAIDQSFLAARARGHEGLLIKDPESGYTPGRRGLSWLKLKKAYATLDCVVVRAEYGHGRRHGVLSDYTFAVRDDHDGRLRVIGKAYSGLTQEEIAGLTTHFLGRVLRQDGRALEVIPDVVLEIAFDAIQPSARHDSGLALRFPRIVRIRTDKTAMDIDTLETARRLGSGKVERGPR